MVFKEGNLPWNKCLVAETDERVRKNVERAKETKKRQFQDEDYKKRYLIKNKGCFKKGDIRLIGNKFNVGKIPYNKGLTKETDERVMEYAKKLRGRKVSDATRKKLSLAKEIKLDMNLIKKEYIENEKSCKEIGKMFGTNHGTIWNRLKKEGVNLRDVSYISKEGLKRKSEFASKRIGEKASNWQGGLSFEHYGPEFNNKFKRAIRKRENQVCIKCGIHREKLSKALFIHHINYNKKLTIPQNCCAVCNNCNSEVNGNRAHWQKFFQSLLSEKYGYQYSEDGEIILELGKKENLNGT